MAATHTRSRQVVSIFAQLLALTCSVSFGFSEQGEKAQAKALQAQAKTLIKEAKALESKGALSDSRSRLVQSQAFRDSDDAQNGIKRLDDKIRKQTDSALKTARQLYKQGKFREAATALEATSSFRKASPDVDLNLALCYRQLGDFPTAIAYLEIAASATQEPKRRQQLAEWRTVLMTGEPQTADWSAKSREQAQSLNRMMSDLDAGGKRMFGSLNRPQGQEIGTDPADAALTTSDEDDFANVSRLTAGVCQALEKVDAPAASNPAVLFNLANCAENANSPQRAADLLQKYLDAAPNATDASRVRARIKDLRLVAELPEPQGSRIRALYAAASEYKFTRRHDLAMAALQKAAIVAPEFAPTEWRLAMLYETRADVDAARQHFTKYLQLETSADDQEAARHHLETLEAKRDLYRAGVDSAVSIVSDLLIRAMNLPVSGSNDRSAMFKQADKDKKRAYAKKANVVGGFLVPAGYAQQQLGEALGHLAKSLSVAPSAAEANQLMGLLMLQANDAKAATKAFDAVASAGFPVAFYAQMRGHKQDRAVKCELTKDGIELIYLASYGKNSKPIPPERRPGNDGLADLIIPAAGSRAQPVDSLKLSARDIRSVETKDGHMILKLAKEELGLSFLSIGSAAEVAGPQARRFANNYTRLFVRYGGLEKAKLGAEGLTGFEKVKLGYRLASNGMTLALSLNPVGAFSAAQSAFEITNALRGAAKSLKVSYGVWERTLLDQQAAESGEPFKAIPTQRPNWAFVE